MLAFCSESPVIKLKAFAQLDILRGGDEPENVCVRMSKYPLWHDPPLSAAQILLMILPVPAGVAETLKI